MAGLTSSLHSRPENGRLLIEQAIERQGKWYDISIGFQSGNQAMLPGSSLPIGWEEDVRDLVEQILTQLQSYHGGQYYHADHLEKVSFLIEQDTNTQQYKTALLVSQAADASLNGPTREEVDGEIQNTLIELSDFFWESRSFVSMPTDPSSPPPSSTPTQGTGNAPLPLSTPSSDRVDVSVFPSQRSAPLPSRMRYPQSLIPLLNLSLPQERRRERLHFLQTGWDDACSSSRFLASMTLEQFLGIQADLGDEKREQLRQMFLQQDPVLKRLFDAWEREADNFCRDWCNSHRWSTSTPEKQFIDYFLTPLITYWS